MEYLIYTTDSQNCWRQGLIDCYKMVFMAPPWNEDWWTDVLVQDVLERYAGPNARIILAVEDEVVIGFSWGAVWTTEELSDELGLQLPLSEGKFVGYVKDIGVIKDYRQRGVAQSLLKELLATLQQSCESNDWIYARTLVKPEPSVVYKWFPNLGFSVVTKYPEESSRNGQVILGCRLHSLTL